MDKTLNIPTDLPFTIVIKTDDSKTNQCLLYVTVAHGPNYATMNVSIEFFELEPAAALQSILQEAKRQNEKLLNNSIVLK
jgi:outer membrane protein assembly factor BamA